jgi:hypothetical protein
MNTCNFMYWSDTIGTAGESSRGENIRGGGTHVQP